jgi:hypothetical protein
VSEHPEGIAADPPRRWFSWLPRNLEAGISGSVLAASVAVGASGQDGTALALILVVTGFVLRVAHMYPEIAASVHGGRQMGAITRPPRDARRPWWANA